MKFNMLKTAMAITLATVSGFASASTNEALIDNDQTLFNNPVAAKVEKTRVLDAKTLVKLVQGPSMLDIKTNLGDSKNVYYTDETETWFYGFEIPNAKSNKEQCVVAFIFNVEKQITSKQADLVSFDNLACENIVAQQLNVK